jgi:predicted transposase YdaD
VINLWEVNAEIVFERSLKVLLPFVPILKQGGEPEIVQRALNHLWAEDQLVELESLLAFFATFVLGTKVVRQIMRWDMAVLRESPWYNEILQEGERLGAQKGREEGCQQEKLLIFRLLQQKVGQLPEAIRDRLTSLPLEQLEELAIALLDFSSLSDLMTWLED